MHCCISCRVRAKVCLCPPKLKNCILHVCLCPQPVLQIFIILNSGNNSNSEGEELTTSAPCGARRQQDTYWRTLFRNRSIEEVHRLKLGEERSNSYSSVKGGKESRIAYIISISYHMQSGNKELFFRLHMSTFSIFLPLCFPPNIISLFLGLFHSP